MPQSRQVLWRREPITTYASSAVIQPEVEFCDTDPVFLIPVRRPDQTAVSRGGHGSVGTDPEPPVR